nr:reverse transcriptase domain-containing protein [Tanacetum cinerariifolium]
VLGPERDRVINDLSQEDKDKYKANVHATNILLQGLSKDIYKLINNYTAAKDIWDTVKFLLEGFELTKDERESQLFSSLINEMRNIKMTMSKMQLNSKFVNNMLPEWGRFVTQVKLNRGPVYDEAGLSYNTDILSKVHDYNDYLDNVGEHQEVQEMQNNVQQCYVVETDVDHTSDSNMILPAFVEANYETLESLVRDRRRQMRNNNHRTELDYFSEDYDEEREMEPRPKPARAVTPPLRAASPNVHRRRERVVRFEETKQRGKQGLRNSEGGCLRKKHKEGILALPNNIGGNLPSNGKNDKRVTPAEAPILMVSQGTYVAKDPTLENMAYEGGEITFLPVIEVNNAPLVIEAEVFGRKVGRVYMDSGSSCEVIYEHCFEKLNSTVKASKVDLKTPLVGFLGECSWKNNHAKNKDRGLNNHGAIKFYTKKGIGTILSANITKEGTKKARKIPITNEERILSCIDVEGTIIMNDRTIMVDRKPFNTEHKLNEYSHIKPIKQNKQGLGPDHNTSACKEIEELIKAGILRKVKHQTWVANPVMVKKSSGGWRMPEKTRRVAKWAIELGEHGIVFLRRDEKETRADVLLEMPFEDNENKVKEKEVSDSSNEWKLYTDRASSSDGSRAGLILIDLAGPRIAQEMEIAKVVIFLDLQLLVNQIKVEHVQRNQNKKADALSKLA